VLLRGGTIRLYEGAQVTERLFVSGGFAEITPSRVTVLADEATPVAAVSPPRASGGWRRPRATTTAPTRWTWPRWTRPWRGCNPPAR
jgi:F-type H+-transporting ATPase subunit epsilon